MKQTVDAFDHWIRHRFVAMNTELEELYFAQQERSQVEGVGEATKQALLQQGRQFILSLLQHSHHDEDFEHGFDLLGSVGLYMAACRRHELTNPERESSSPLQEASALCLQLGAALGLTPRFITSHLTTHNRAIDGHYKSFTALADEQLFLDYNTRSILAYKRAADALLRILPMGVSHPACGDLLAAATQALHDVLDYHRQLYQQLDAQRFFYCVRPYYKPHRVGLHVYRGANAGDFAGINVVDLLLGLCRADDAFYSQLLVDKFLYMTPQDQAQLRDCLHRKSLLDSFLQHRPEHRQRWYQQHAAQFLELCKLHGEIAALHHDQLVQRFIEQPAQQLNAPQLAQITASGPPLALLLQTLEKLRDLRLAAARDDIPSRAADIQALKESLP